MRKSALLGSSNTHDNAGGDRRMLAHFVKRVLNQSQMVSRHSDVEGNTSKAIVSRLSASDPRNGMVPCHM